MSRRKTYLGRVLVATDQWFNTLAGGHEDQTISARLGFLYSTRPSSLTTLLMRIVDATFYTIDGRLHCLQAYIKDEDGEYIKGNNVALALLSLFVVGGCIIIFIPAWVWGSINKHQSKSTV